MSRVAIIGCGPTGLAACQELLELGYEPSQINLIDVNRSEFRATNQTYNGKSLTIHESFKSSSANGSFKKPSGQNLKNSSFYEKLGIPASNAHVWGSSCLPLASWARFSSINCPELSEKYSHTISRWNVHAQSDSLERDFKLTTEITNELKRKSISESFSAECSKSDIAGGHSRIAMFDSQSQPCYYCGNCLQGCPTSVPWNPSKELNNMIAEFPDLRIITGKVVKVRIEAETPDVVFQNGEILQFDQVFVAAGWRQTPRMLRDSHSESDYSKELLQSTVVMRAFILDDPVDDSDFFNSFSYHDSVISIPPKSKTSSGYLAQIYFPTAELAGRVASVSPRIFHDAISAVLLRDYKWTLNIFKRIGIVMIFAEGGEWNSNKNEILRIEQSTIPEIRKALKLIGGHVIPGVRQTLSNGNSEHVGSWEPFRKEALQLLNIEEKANLKLPKVLPIDTTLLPIVPPGPHTAIAASLSRIAVSHWLSQ
jgi:ferredoxin